MQVLFFQVYAYSTALFMIINVYFITMYFVYIMVLNIYSRLNIFVKDSFAIRFVT